MGKRLLAPVVALVVMCAPVALDVCRITCAAKAMASSMPADDAPCHEHAGGPQLSSSSVPCDHSVEATPSLVAAKHVDTVVSSLSALPLRYSTASLHPHGFTSAGGLAPAARLAIPLAMPLRV